MCENASDTCHPRHPIHCITPPHMLREIADRGTAAQRERAIRTLLVSGQFSGQRQALTGIELPGVEKALGGKNRIVYDADHASSLPGRAVRREGDAASGDLGVDEAYDGSGATYDFYHDIYERDSIDGQGLRLDSTVHFQRSYDNAFWNGTQMVYGDGDEDQPEADRIFNRFTVAVDVIGHELTHGVTQYEAKLIYQDQAGALNEHLSDVFGSLVKQHVRNQTADQADWIIGEGLFGPSINGVGIRSMKEPGTAYNDPRLGRDPQPGHMRDYKNMIEDNGGVHINSGIPNHAFYLVARELGGFAWEKAGRIWYITLRDKLGPRSQFADAARLTIEAAGELFGAGSLEQQAVTKGWSEVGVTPEVGDGGGEPSGCLVTPVATVIAITRMWQKK